VTTSTLFSTLSYNQNAAGPPVPAGTIVNTGGLIFETGFTLTVTPPTGWAQANIAFGDDGVSFPGHVTLLESPTGTGTTTHRQRFHAGVTRPDGANDGAQYFQAELTTISPGATATLTMTY
jgi:hypothetical protein